MDHTPEFKVLASECRPCDDGDCSKIMVRAGSPMGFVQGYKLSPEERAAFNIPEGEDVLGVPLSVLIEGGREAERL